MKNLACRLNDAGLKPFLDVWELSPGEAWQEGLEAGDSLADGRYELLDIIGQGGFAHVWLAFD